MSTPPALEFPAAIQYGRVRMRAIMAIGDSVDPDETPDVSPIPSSAKVHFTPPTYALRTLVPGADGLAVTISQQAKVTATFDAEGYLCTRAGQRDVWLVATTPGLDPYPFAYKVEFENLGGAVAPFDLIVEADSVTDLSLQRPTSPTAPITVVSSVAERVRAEDAALRAEEAAAEAERAVLQAAAAIVDAITDHDSELRERLDALYAGPAVTLRGDIDRTGASDVSTLVLAAVTEAASFGLAVEVPAGFYRMDQPLPLGSGAHLRMHPQAVLDFGAVAPGGGTAVSLIRSAGTSSAEVELAADAPRGSLTVTLSSTAGFAVGDRVRIRSNRIFDASSTQIKHAELGQIAAIDGSTITLRTPLSGGPYLMAEGARFHRYEPVRNIRISGGRIKGRGVGGNHIGVDLRWGVACTLDDVMVQDIDRVQISLTNCVDSHVRACHLADAVHNTTAYGVSFNNSSQDCSCLDSTFTDVRHSLSTNNSSAADEGGIPRRVMFRGNTVRGSTTALGGSQLGGDAIDTHTAAEDIWVLDNIVYRSAGQGINFEARSGRVERNTVRFTASNGINVHNESDLAGAITVRDNFAADCADKGINVRTGGRTTPGGVNTTGGYEWIAVTGNTAVDCGNEGVFVGGAIGAAPVMARGIVSANTVLRCGNVASPVGMAIYRMTDVTVTDNEISDTRDIATYKGMRLTGVSGGVVQGNVIRVPGANTYGLLVDNDCSAITVGPNSITASSTAREVVLGTGAGNRQVAYAGDAPAFSTGGTSPVSAAGLATIPPTVQWVGLDTAGGVATLDLTRLDGGAPGQVVTLAVVNDTRSVRVRHTTSAAAGNIRLAPGLPTSVLLSNRTQTLTLAWSSYSSTWNEVARQGQGDATQVATSIDWTGAVALSAAEARPGAFITRRLSGAATLTLPAGEAGVAHSCTLLLTQDATGGRTLTIPGALVPGGVAPTLSTAAGAVDLLHLLWNGTAWMVLVGGLAMAVPA